MAASWTRDMRSELTEALAQCRSGLIGVGVISGALNMLALGSAIFIILVYGSVLPSRSTSTLLGLLIFIIMVFGFIAVLDVIRGRMLTQVGASLGLSMGRRVHDVVGQLALRDPRAASAIQPVADLDAVRRFLSSGSAALIDLPWVIFFLLILFLFHPWLGVTALVGAIVLAILTVATERMSHAPTRSERTIGATRGRIVEASRRHAEVIRALGMRGPIDALWTQASDRLIAAEQRLFDTGATMAALAKTFRLLLQALVVAVGALLAIDNKTTGGVIFASVILTARALAPVEIAIANWRGFVAARHAWARLSKLLGTLPPTPETLQLPPPAVSVSAEHLTLMPPGSQLVTAANVSFNVSAGQSVGIIGPSGSGKSSVARGLAGAWRPARGTVRIDGAALDQWDSDALGRHVGYLPQTVDLLDGTVAENIARFDPDPPQGAVIEAAQRAGIHEMIVRLPDGYETPVGDRGEALSAGQRQRIGLARALYRDPFIVILDEPYSHLDSEGEAALGAALTDVRERGGILLVVAQRPSVLAAVDQILFMRDGRMQDFGPKEEVLGRLRNRSQPKPAIAEPVAAQE